MYEVRPRKDKSGVDLISDALPFDRLWYTKPDNAIGYATHSSRSHDAVIRVYDAAGNVIETHEHVGAYAGSVDVGHAEPNSPSEASMAGEIITDSTGAVVLLSP